MSILKGDEQHEFQAAKRAETPWAKKPPMIFHGIVTDEEILRAVGYSEYPIFVELSSVNPEAPDTAEVRPSWENPRVVRRFIRHPHLRSLDMNSLLCQKLNKEKS